MSFPKYPRYKDSGVEWLGEVPEHWKLTKLKYIANFSGGGTPSRDVPEYWNGEIPWVSPKDMKTEDITGAEECITDLGLQSSASSLVPKGRLLIVTRSGILKHTIPVAVSRISVALNQDMKALHFFDGRDPATTFFLRWIQGLNDRLLLAWGKLGATVESIEQQYLANTVVALPEQIEQELIVTFLGGETGRIDLLITEQRRLVELLREKRQAVISHAVTKGLDPDVTMKPSCVEWLGDVPAHWKITKLKHIAQFSGGGTPSREILAYWGGDIPWVSPKDMKTEKLMGSEESITELGLQGSASSMIPVETPVLVVRSGILRHTIPVAVAGVDVALNQDIKAVHLNPDQCTSEFFMRWVQGLNDALVIAWAKQGATVESIEHELLASTTIPLPTIEEQQAIIVFLKEQLARLDTLRQEAQTAIALLRERRSALISAAVTGKIDVRGLAEQVA